MMEKSFNHMQWRTIAAAGVLVLAFSLTACSSPSGDEGTPTVAPPTPGTSPVPHSASATPPETTDQQVVGTVVRFTAGSTSVDVTIGEDNPATRDFLTLLPLSLALAEFNGREKIAYLPRRLEHEGASGSDPEDGNLIYYIPWGNIGFYYNTDGVGYSDQTIHLGTYDTTLDELELLEGQEVTVEIVR